VIWRPVSSYGSGDGRLVVLPGALQLWWCTWSVLEGGAEGPWVFSLELVHLVQW
jgi:hypothetical protein